MSENREPSYLVLNWDEDFSLKAHVDSDGYQRIAATGYIQKVRNGALWRAPIIPELFFGADGEQLETWRQYLHAGNQTVLRRDSGNPYVPDKDLFWSKVRDLTPQQPRQPPVAQAQAQTMDMTGALVSFGILTFAVAAVYLLSK